MKMKKISNGENRQPAARHQQQRWRGRNARLTAAKRPLCLSASSAACGGKERRRASSMRLRWRRSATASGVWRVGSRGGKVKKHNESCSAEAWRPKMAKIGWKRKMAWEMKKWPSRNIWSERKRSNRKSWEEQLKTLTKRRKSWRRNINEASDGEENQLISKKTAWLMAEKIGNVSRNGESESWRKYRR